MNFFSIIICSLFIALASFRSCGVTPELRPGEYVSWSDDPENGLVTDKQVGNLKFELQYKPLEYIVLKDNAGLDLSAAEMKKQKEAVEDMQYFTFRISSEKEGDLLQDDISGIEQFSSRLQYFSSGMQKDLFLVEGHDTLPCLLFHFERAYGIDPRSTFVLGFSLGKKDGPGGMPAAEDKTLCFDDNELGVGPVRFTIDADKINHTPYLNLP